MVTIRNKCLLVSLLVLTCGAPACGGGGSASPAQTAGVVSKPSSTTWTALPNPFPASAMIYNLGWDSQSQALWASVNGVGMYVSTDHGQTWTQQNTGLPAYKVTQIGFSAIGDPIAVDGTNPPAGVFRYANGSWLRGSGLSATFSFAKPLLDKTGAIIEVTAWGADVFRSTDNGNTFTKTASNITGGSGALWCSTLGPDGTLYAGGEAPAGAYMSKDNGSTWTAIGPAVPTYTGNITAMVVTNSGQLIVGRASTQDGSELQGYTGSGWQNSASGVPPWSQIITLCKDTSGNLYALAAVRNTTGGGKNFIYRSTNGGQSWAEFDTGVAPGILTVTADNAGNVYAVTVPGKSGSPAAAIYTISTGGASAQNHGK